MLISLLRKSTDRSIQLSHLRQLRSMNISELTVHTPGGAKQQNRDEPKQQQRKNRRCPDQGDTRARESPIHNAKRSTHSEDCDKSSRRRCIKDTSSKSVCEENLERRRKILMPCIRPTQHLRKSQHLAKSAISGATAAPHPAQPRRLNRWACTIYAPGALDGTHP